MYSIYYDGGELVGVEQNGDLFVVSTGLRREDLGAVLRNVRIEGEPSDEYAQDKSGEYALMRCSYFCDKGAMQEFVLVPYDEGELAMRSLEGKLEYVAMMAGVEL